jgi:probable selenium-dependent hydroxylase accessory protein YqeC
VAGAGGKTTLVYRLAAECRAAGWRVLVTTTTHMGTLPEAVTGPVFVEADGDPRDGIRAALAGPGLATLLGRRVREDKLEGIAPERVDALAADADVVLVEADGARGRSLKAPAAHEPVIASRTTVLVVVAALDVLGRPLDDRLVHRVDEVAAASGRGAGAPVDADMVVAALAWPAGYVARRPAGARAAVFFNKVEDAPAAAAARGLAGRLVPPYERVVAGAARGGPVERLA